MHVQHKKFGNFVDMSIHTSGQVCVLRAVSSKDYLGRCNAGCSLIGMANFDNLQVNAGLNVSQCLKLLGLKILSAFLYHFAYASQCAYGAVTYIRFFSLVVWTLFSAETNKLLATSQPDFGFEQPVKAEVKREMHVSAVQPSSLDNSLSTLFPHYSPLYARLRKAVA